MAHIKEGRGSREVLEEVCLPWCVFMYHGQCQFEVQIFKVGIFVQSLSSFGLFGVFQRVSFGAVGFNLDLRPGFGCLLSQLSQIDLTCSTPSHPPSPCISVVSQSRRCYNGRGVFVKQSSYCLSQVTPTTVA